MSQQSKVFLLLWGPFLYFADAASVSRVSASLFEPSVSTYFATDDSHEERATGNLTNTNSLGFESNVELTEKATQQAPTNEARLSKVRAKRAGSRRNSGLLLTPAAIKGSSVLGSRRVSIALLLLVWLVVVGLNKLPLLEREVPGLLIDEGRTEAKARLEQVKRLLPAAERLALAVGFDQASELLAIVQGALQQVDERKVDASHKKLNDALQALCTLHNAAIGRAKEIIRTDRDFPVLSPLIMQGDDKSARLGRDTEHLIMLTHHSLCECSAKLAHMFDGVSIRVLSERNFRDVEDGDVLLNTAISLESLRAISSFRRHFAAVADDLREDAISSLKISLSGRSQMGIRNIEGNLALLRVRVASLEKTGKTAEEFTAQRKQVDIGFVEGRLEKVAFLLSQLRLIGEAVEVSTTVEAAREAAARAADLEKEANELLEECSSFVGRFVAFVQSFEGGVEVSVKGVAEKQLTIAEMENFFLLKTVQEASDMIEDAHAKALTTGAFRLNDHILIQLLDSAEDISVREEGNFDRIKFSAQNLKDTHNAADAVDELRHLKAGMFVHAVNKLQAQLLKLRCRLVAFLQEDMNFVASEAERISTQDFNFSDLGKRKYGRLRKKLRAALKAAEKAPTLLEAAVAAADVRTYSLALQDFVLGSDKFQNKFL